MGLEAIFADLAGCSAALCESLQALGLTVVEDRPAHDQTLLVERFGDRVENFCGLAQEVDCAVREARMAVTHPPDLYRARVALVSASAGFLKLEHGFFGQAVCYDTIHGLRQFGRSRGGEWRGWSGIVTQALVSCHAPLRAVDEALLRAWDELAACGAAGHATLSQTTIIGQQMLTASHSGGRPADRPLYGATEYSQRTSPAGD